MSVSESTKELQPELEYVGFWARVGASLVDTVLLLAVSFPLLRLLGSHGADFPDMRLWHSSLATPLASAPLGGAPLAGDAGSLFFDWLLPAAAVIAFWLARQATPGKMLISARIVDARTGRKPGPGQAVVRYLGYFLSTLPFCLGLIWVGLDRRKQGWHDKLAGTVVVRPRRPGVKPGRLTAG